jgi:hypothetical protein
LIDLLFAAAKKTIVSMRSHVLCLVTLAAWAVAADVVKDAGGEYDGDLVDGVKHGRGKHTRSNGDVYDGEYTAGHEHGVGTLTYSHGTTYEGEWQAGKKHGHGALRWGVRPKAAGGGAGSVGSSYVGQYADDAMHGRGVLTMATTTFDGDFVKGAKEGHGRTVFQDGSSFEGEYLGGIKHGRGTATQADGTVSSGRWEHDHMVEKDVAPAGDEATSPEAEL